MINLLIIITVFAICLLFTTLWLLVNGEDSSKQQKFMAYFICGSIVQNAGYLFELTASNVEAAIVATKIEYLGSIFIPICFCWFIYLYCYRKIPKYVFRFIEALDVFILAAVWTCDYHTFYYREIGWAQLENNHYCLSLTYGPGYTIFMLFSCISTFLLAFITLFRMLFLKSSKTAKKQYGLIISVMCLPVLALLAYALKLTKGYDMTPAVLGLALSLVSIFVWSRRNYDYGRLAATAVLEGMGDGIITLDEQKRLAGYNQAAADIFQELNEHKLGDTIDSIEVFPKDILDEDTYKEFCFHNRYFESHSRKIVNQKGRSDGYAILILDVTKTKEYIEEIKNVREQAEQANLAKSEFLANMSHEIRTPMNAIMGLSDIIKEESAGRRIYSYACDIRSAAQNLLAIINDILDLSKVEAGKMEIIPREYYLKTMVDEVVNMMDIAASQRGILMKCEFNMLVPCQYYGDDGRIKQVLINLLNNAIKFTKEGYVKISIDGHPGDERDEEVLEFTIEDTGCGIKEEDLEKIFENFSQVNTKQNRSVEGTGLGLSISKQLIALMNGSLTVKSVYGEGTTFTVILPQKITDTRTLEDMPTAPVQEELESVSFTAKGYRVLVVDDNRVNRKVAINFLKNYGFDLTESESGYDAIELVKKEKFNIIFMDHMMPEMDGIETVQRIRVECGENGISPIIIALTANVMQGVREQFLNNGFQDFVSKPINRKELGAVLLKWIPNEDREMQKLDAPEEFIDSDYFKDVNLPGIEIEKAMELHSNNVADILELLQLYSADGIRKLELLKTLWEQRDYKNYQVEVHGIKGSSATIGAMEVAALAKQQEEAAKKEDESYIETHFDEFYKKYEELIKVLQEYFDKGDAAQLGSDTGKSIDNQILMNEVMEALKCLERFRSKECADKIEHLLTYQLNDDIREKLQEIKNRLKLYEDDEAETLLHRFLEQ